MRLFVLTHADDYEGEGVEGVYTTLEEARAHARGVHGDRAVIHPVEVNAPPESRSAITGGSYSLESGSTEWEEW